ncbi:MAG: hypothetical protein ACTIC1_19215 [Brevibacterium sp.]
MSRRDAAPERIRKYRVDAEARQSPDLHKLAQLFIGMAQARARAAQPAPDEPEESVPGDGQESAR